MKTQRENKPKLTLKNFRLWLVARDSNVADFARRHRKSRGAVYGALKAPTLFPKTRRILEEAFHA